MTTVTNQYSVEPPEITKVTVLLLAHCRAASEQSSTLSACSVPNTLARI